MGFTSRPSLLLLLAAQAAPAVRGLRRLLHNSTEEDLPRSDDDIDYRDVIAKHVGQCIDPERPDRLHKESGAWESLVWSKIDNESFGLDAWSDHSFNMRWVPIHYMAGLVRSDSKYPKDPPEEFYEKHNPDLDSECFSFDYDQETGPDPAGCRIFAKSFRPLQQLRTCIVGHLDQDPVWSQRHSTTMEDGAFSGTYMEWCRQHVWKKYTVGVWPLSTSFPVKLCKRVDTKRRAQEMIKMVLYRPPVDDADKLAKHVERKLCKTVTWPQQEQAAPCLHEDTKAAIRSQCFKVEAGEPLSKFEALGKVSPCLPLMYDKVEINGFGVGDGATKFQDETYYGREGRGMWQSVTPSAPSACGRLALAAIPGFQTARYSVLTSGAAAVSETLGYDTEPTWRHCLAVEETNCRKMYFCWERALRRFCALSPRCCPGGGDEAVALAAHHACWAQRNRGECPRALKTVSGNH